jgi:NADH:ubiquinone oxidoreductase subunit 2 (subunit N)
LRIIVSMWLSDSPSSEPLELSVASRLALLTTVVVTLILGVVPGMVLRLDGLSELFAG